MCVGDRGEGKGASIAKVWQVQDLDLQEMVLFQSRALSCVWLPDVWDSRHIPPLPAAFFRKSSLTKSGLQKGGNDPKRDLSSAPNIFMRETEREAV